MTAFDIICGLLLIWAAWRGFRDGIIVQLAGIVGLLGAVWLAYRYCPVAGRWLALDGVAGQAAGFLLIFIPALVAVALLGRLLRGLFNFAGLGMFDQIGGLLVGVLKIALMVSVLLTAYGSLKPKKPWPDAQARERSWLYRPVMEAGEVVFPYLEFVRDRFL